MTDGILVEPSPGDGAIAGLCASCRWTRVVQTRKGSRFFLCRLSETDGRFPRYPGLPVVACDGFELRSTSSSKETE